MHFRIKHTTLGTYVYDVLCIYVFQLDRTALQWSAANGHTEIMQLLMKYGADVETQDKVCMPISVYCIITNTYSIVDLA